MQNKKINLKVNIVLNILYEILVVLTPLITAPYVSRVLQPAGVGIYSYTNSLVTYFVMFAALGTAGYGKREIARLRDNKEQYSKAFWEIELITIFTTLMCTIGWIIFSFCYSKYKIYMLIWTFTLVSQIFDISWLYGGLEKFQYTVLINSLCKMASVISIFLFIKSIEDVNVYILICSVSTLVGAASMWFFLPKQLCKTEISFKTMIQHFKNTLVYFLPTIASSIYTVLDKTLIGAITKDDAQNGYYEQATKVLTIIKSACFVAINGVTTSRASYLYANKDEAGMKRLMDMNYQLTTFLTVGACFGIAAIAKTFVPLFFGNGYNPVITIIYILSPITLCICISGVAGSVYYTPANKIKLASILMIFGSLLNLILNIILIPNFGSYGAAVGSVAAELLIAVLFVCFSKGYISWNMIFVYLWKKIIAGIIMFLSIFCIQLFLDGYINDYLLLSVELLAGVCIYSLILLILRDKSMGIAIDMVKTKVTNFKNK
ncbi:MAG: oligosaccharide flippase family protein [Methanosphaera sp.]|nr:oligosaccharide flippase family protein [Methanosphaera sp.]